MIRRLFWLTLGAALGITGYRRVAALARSMSPAARTGDVVSFVADVREGMALYKERHHPPEGRTLESHWPRGRQRGQSPGTAGPGTGAGRADTAGGTAGTGRADTGGSRVGTGRADSGADRAGAGRQHSGPDDVKDGR